MRRSMPQVREFMTPAPKTVPADLSLREAEQRMRKLGFRHFPVMEGKKVVGVLTQRNVALVADRPDLAALKVSDVMIPDPFCVDPAAGLDMVAATMAEEKFGCVVVCNNEDGSVEGIFTTVDACRALRELLESVFPQ